MSGISRFRVVFIIMISPIFISWLHKVIIGHIISIFFSKYMTKGASITPSTSFLFQIIPTYFWVIILTLSISTLVTISLHQSFFTSYWVLVYTSTFLACILCPVFTYSFYLNLHLFFSFILYSKFLLIFLIIVFLNVPLCGI